MVSPEPPVRIRMSGVGSKRGGKEGPVPELKTLYGAHKGTRICQVAISLHPTKCGRGPREVGPRPGRCRGPAATEGGVSHDRTTSLI